MWSRCYRQHVIMAFPSFDTATNLWAAQADITGRVARFASLNLFGSRPAS